MRSIVLPVLTCWLLCGCAPGTDDQGRSPPRAGISPAANAPGDGRSEPPAPLPPSYEVSIASAEADRVRARDLCDTGERAERRACVQAADAAYDHAKSAAENSRSAAP
jgi:hypothetical protein